MDAHAMRRRLRVDGVESAADAGDRLQRVRALRDERPPLSRCRQRRDAETAARRVEVGVDEQLVADHLHVIDRPHVGSDRNQHVVVEAQQVNGVRVHEVPLVEDGEAAALADLNRAPVPLHTVVAEDPLGRRARPEPVLVDGVPLRLVARGHLVGLGICGIEKP
jgi:hypothetical protein